jgi:hypothetical protein
MNETKGTTTMRIINTMVVLAVVTVIYDLTVGLPFSQWLWERGLIGGIHGLCLGIVLCGGLLIVERAR